MLTNEQLENFFIYHPPSADQTDAIRKIREARMTANSAIACNE